MIKVQHSTESAPIPISVQQRQNNTRGALGPEVNDDDADIDRDGYTYARRAKISAYMRIN